MSEHELWNELGNLYFMSGAYNQAVYAYHRSIQLDSRFGRPYSNLALTYVQQGKYEEAIELYRNSIELLADNKEKAISWSRLGNVYRHLKKYTQAVVAYQQADELDPQISADVLPQPAEEILPESSSDIRPIITADIPQEAEKEISPLNTSEDLPVEIEDFQPEDKTEVISLRSEDSLEQAAADILPDIADDVMSQSPEALPQVEDILAAVEEYPSQPASDILSENADEIASQVSEALPQPGDILDAGDEHLVQSLPDILPENAEETISQVSEALPQPEDILDAGDEYPAQSLPDILTENAADINYQDSEALAQPEDVRNAVEESPAQLVPDIRSEIVDEISSQESEALPQPEDVLKACEEPVEIEDAVSLASSIEGNQACSPTSIIEENPTSDDAVYPSNESHEEFKADSPVRSPLPEELMLQSVDELDSEIDSELSSASLDDSTASWGLADLPRYQEDISESPETGSLTIWGEPDFEEDDWDLYPAPEVDIPEPDGDGLTRWVPLPVEEPGNELEEIELVDVTQEEMAEVEKYHSNFYEVIDTLDCQKGPSGSQPQASNDMPDQMASVFPLALPSICSVQRSEEFSKPAAQLLEVDVEERPAAMAPSSYIREFVWADERQNQAPETKAEIVEEQTDVQKQERNGQEMNELEASIAKFKRAVQNNPRNAYAWDALGTLYKSAGQYKEAIQAYQQATSIDPPKALYFHNLGLVYACEGRDEDAIGAFEKVVEIDPNYSLAHATLGGYYRKMGREELAQQHIGKAMKNIFDSENEYNRACLEAICGNYDHAFELLRVALRNKQTYVDWILRDPDLDFIRQDPRFKQLVSDYAR